MTCSQVVGMLLLLGVGAGTFLILFEIASWMVNRGKVYIGLLIAVWKFQISTWTMLRAADFLLEIKVCP